MSRAFRIVTGFVLFSALGLAAAVAAWAFSVATDEDVIFFRSIAQVETGSQAWTPRIHGWVFEPEADSVVRRLLLKAFAKALGLPAGSEDQAIFNARASQFLVDSQRWKDVQVRVGQTTQTLPKTGANGHFEGPIQVPAGASQGPLPAWLRYAAVLPAGDPRRFEGAIQLVPPDGVGVISDIDDTIKITQVQDTMEMLRNTFLRPFRPVEGMPQAYNRWADAGAVFVYLSASPWQLYPPLAAFLDEQGFPRGAVQLKLFRPKDESFVNLAKSPEAYKIPAIEAVLARLPKRSFVLVGDSGEKDPEIYAEIARRHPGRVRQIFIRRVGGQGDDQARYDAAFKGVPGERWALFTDPAVLQQYNVLDRRAR
ncbi:MAG: DUF2183 domain-containing protein [Candidatus Riflebacteria bacterium]|nr:DUF2183 domain-containing protein [Candidatus Riflebacteria bacterium]